MLLQEPQRTAYDIQFPFLGFPVRIHPAFFILPIVLGADLARRAEFNAGMVVVILVIVFFISILVHELGHAIVMKRYGLGSRIVLYLMGGLAIPETAWDNPWRNKKSMTPQRRIAISAAGPGAGFLLFGVFCAVIFALGGRVWFDTGGLIPMPVADLSETGLAGNEAAYLFFHIALFCNYFWSILNLVPVFPLDGGQISMELFQMRDYRGGVRKALLVGTFTAGLLAFYGFAVARDPFIGFFFAYMAIHNYLMMQQVGGGGWS